ncbi:basic salivary proline-rich protein 1-like [Zerene cesonia]|uniref:basic salivary proline-rich protein 1-like n=1 Tax=Zerene cesonia TaxID=33412 RepID=UPI0018E563F0|nr:basic salivary proline-rich protein 1-like [Zerene cesonia]
MNIRVNEALTLFSTNKSALNKSQKAEEKGRDWEGCPFPGPPLGRPPIVPRSTIGVPQTPGPNTRFPSQPPPHNQRGRPSVRPHGPDYELADGRQRTAVAPRPPPQGLTARHQSDASGSRQTVLPASQPASQPYKQLVSQPGNQPVPGSRPDGIIASQPASQPVGQPVPVRLPAGTPSSHRAYRITSRFQPASQPAFRTESQPASYKDPWPSGQSSLSDH